MTRPRPGPRPSPGNGHTHEHPHTHGPEPEVIDDERLVLLISALWLAGTPVAEGRVELRLPRYRLERMPQHLNLNREDTEEEIILTVEDRDRPGGGI
jgi:hypothetical protein